MRVILVFYIFTSIYTPYIPVCIIVVYVAQYCTRYIIACVPGMVYMKEGTAEAVRMHTLYYTADGRVVVPQAARRYDHKQLDELLCSIPSIMRT